jgi:hypothetical protein
VCLIGRRVDRVDLDRSRGKGAGEIADSGIGKAARPGSGFCCLCALGAQVIDADQLRSGARLFEGLSENDGDRLMIVVDVRASEQLGNVRRPATNVVVPSRAHRFTADPTFRLANTYLGVAASRSHVEAARGLLQLSKKPGRYPIDIRDRLERKLPRMSSVLLLVGSIGWCWPAVNEFRSLILVSPAQCRFTHMFPIASVLIGVGEKLIPKSDNRGSVKLWASSKSRLSSCGAMCKPKNPTSLP